MMRDIESNFLLMFRFLRLTNRSFRAAKVPKSMEVKVCIWSKSMELTVCIWSAVLTKRVCLPSQISDYEK